MKRFSLLAAAPLLAALFASACASAATEPLPETAAPESPAERGGQESNLPDVAVEKVSLDGAPGPRSAGSVIRGSATVSNPTEYPAEASFDLSLVALDGKRNPGTVYATEVSEDTFSLAPGETKDVPFSMKIPLGLSADDVAVEVDARLVGSIYLGWEYSDRFDVVGKGGFATVEEAYFTLPDGRKVSRTDGPTIYPDAPRDQLPLSVVLRGQGGAIDLYPIIVVENRALGTSERRELDAVVKVPETGVVTAVIPFAHGGQEPGVYEGEVSWRGSDGGEHGRRLGFRYIVAGEAATVHSVSSSASSVEKGQDFALSMSVSGMPPDQFAATGTPDIPRAPSRVNVRVVDADGALVAEDSYVGVLPLVGEVSFQMTAERAAATMRADVEVLGSDGRPLFSRTYPLSVGKTPPLAPSPNDSKLAFSIAAIAAVVALSGALIASRRGRPKEALVAVLVAALAWGLAYSSSSAMVEIYRRSTGTDIGCTGPNIYMGSPTMYHVYNVGDNFTVKGRVQAQYCSNTGSDGYTTLTLRQNGRIIWGPVYVLSLYDPGGAGHVPTDYVGKIYQEFNGYLTQEGTYRIGLHAYYNYSGTCITEVDGITDIFVVSNPSAPTSCTVDKLRTVLGDPTTWTAAGCKDQCEWDGLGVLGSTYTKRATAAGTFGATVRSKKTYYWPSVDANGNSITVSEVRYSPPRTCDTTVVVEDLCNNLDGVQNPVPTGLTRNAGGACVCNTGTYNAANGRCEDDDGNCTSCGTCTGSGCGGNGCPTGTKYCDGVCIDADAACGTTVVSTCPLPAPETQYCVELFDRNGRATDQLAGYSNEQLEAIFGYALPDAVRNQAAAGGSGSPIFGVVGRALSNAGSLDARYGSSGCGGALCAYGGQGCLATINAGTNDPVADCSPANDPAGAAGLGPTAILEVEPSVVGVGGQCIVSWGSHEMRTCQVSGQGVSSTALAGTGKTGPLQTSATYTLSCTGVDGRAYNDSDTCAVNPDVTEF